MDTAILDVEAIESPALPPVAIPLAGRYPRPSQWLESATSKRLPARRAAESCASGLIEPLTQRETQILGLVCNGDSNQEIAEALRLSINAVKFHLQNIFGKLGVCRRTQAVAVAVHLRLVVPAWLQDPGASGPGIAAGAEDSE